MADAYLKYWDIENRLRKERPAPVYAFFGEETFLRRRALGLLRAKLAEGAGGDLDVVVFDLREQSFGDFLNTARTPSLMASCQLITLKYSEKITPALLPKLEAFLARPSARNCVVLEFDPNFNPQKRANDQSQHDKKLLAALEGRAERYLFSRLKDAGLIDFLVRHAQESGYRLGRESIAYLVDRLGGDLELIANEMEKLHLSAGTTREIQPSDLEQLLVKNPYATIFDMLDCLAVRQLGKAYQRLDTLLEAGEHPLGILAMLSRFYQQIMMFRSLRQKGKNESEILQQMRLWPKQYKTLEIACHHYGPEELWQNLGLIGRVEEEYKSVRLDQHHHIELLRVRLCRPKSVRPGRAET